MGHSIHNFTASGRKLFLTREFGRNYFYIICSVVISALIVDSVLNTVADFIFEGLITFWGVALFIILASIYVLGQFFILQHLKSKSKDIRSKSSSLNAVHKVVTASQLFLSAILAYLILQILITQEYNLSHLILVTIVSYSLNAVLMILFAGRLFKWFRSHKNSLVVLLYGISATTLALTTLVAMIADVRHLVVKDPVITPQSPVVYPTLDAGDLSTLLSDVYNYSDLVSVLLVWVSTLVLLHYYSNRLTKPGRIKYWILISLPIIYYLSTFVGFFDLYVAESLSEAYYFYLYISLNSTAAAILFGLAFRMVAKTIRHNSMVRDYMVISAFGFILLFISNQSNLTAGPYPPFGFFTVGFMGLSSYLIYVGIYSAAISMSEDTKLRQSIRRSAIEESKMLVSIGAAQIQEQLERKVIADAKSRAETLTKETGVQLSLSEADMRMYLSNIMREIKVLRNLDEIINKGRSILSNSVEFLGCISYGGLRLIYNNYFEACEKIMEKHTKNEHDGIRFVTSINKDSVEVVKSFLEIGVEIRHVKNLPPIDFAASDKEIIATIQRTGNGEMIQNLLVSNESAYLDHFVSIFEELWKSGIDARDRIDAINEGVDTEGIEIIQNPVEIQNTEYKLIKSATNEILIILPTGQAFQTLVEKQRIRALLRLIREAVVGREVSVRILAPKDEFAKDTLERLQEEIEHEIQNTRRTTAQGIYRLSQGAVSIRYIDSQLLTKMSVLVVDRILSLAIELRDNMHRASNRGLVGLATYSNSKATVESYASIFDTLWKQTELYDQLQVHDRMQKEFINIAAHELRNPIQPLVLSSESLKGSMPDEERVSIVIRNAKKLQILANEILDITKIESNTLTLRKESVYLNEIILYGMKDLLDLQAVSGGRVNVVYEPSNEDIYVEVDRDRLGQVISNLLNNSMKFTDAGTISITAERSANVGEVIVSVKDTGSGIDPEILPRLFSKFATKSDTGGTGLGLYICKSIIEAHGGKIWAENNPDGKGATFTFSLPTSLPPISRQSSVESSSLISSSTYQVK
jgi:signal transduction histidine kinase